MIRRDPRKWLWVLKKKTPYSDFASSLLHTVYCLLCTEGGGEEAGAGGEDIRRSEDNAKKRRSEEASTWTRQTAASSTVADIWFIIRVRGDERIIELPAQDRGSASVTPE